MKKILIILLLIAQNSYSSSYPLESRTLNKESYKIKLDVLWSQTLGFFGSDGTETEAADDVGYQLIDTLVKIDYGFKRNFEIGIDVKYRQIESENSTDILSSAGLESFAVHGKYSFKGSRKNKAAISLTYRKTAYSNEYYLNQSDIPASSDVNLGDDGQSILLTAYYDRVVSKNSHLEFKLSYLFPPNDLGAEIPYSLGYVYKSQNFALGLGVDGIFSLGLDEYEANPDDKPVSNFGSTNRFNSINREMMSLYGQLNYKFSSSYLGSAKLSQVMSGTSTDKSMNVLFSLTFNTGGVSDSQVFENSFKEYSNEANVIKVSPRGVFLKIDKGLAGDVAKGARADVYKTDYFGGNTLVGSGFVYESAADWAIVKLVKKFKRLPIEKGFTVRIK